MSRLAKKLVIALAALLLAVLAAESVVRLTSTPAFDADGARAAAVKLVATMTGNRWRPRETAEDDEAAAEQSQEPEYRLHPYYGLDFNQSDYWLGRDVKRFEAAKAQRAIDIVILGGSVAVRFGNDCQRDLIDAFARDPRWAGWEVRVYIQGRAAFRQPQLLHLFEYLLAIGYEPDVVIELDGFNELALGLQNAQRGMHPALPSIVDWGPIATTAPMTPEALDQVATVRHEQVAAQACFAAADRYDLFRSAVASWIVRERLQGCFNRYALAAAAFERIHTEPSARTYVVGPAFDSSEEAVVETCARIWADSSQMMDAICDRLGIRYVHVLQPTLHDEGSKPLTPDEIRLGAEPAAQIPAIRDGYPKLRERGAELAAAGVEFVDLSRVFVDARQPLYEDTCHFSAEGNRILAAALMPALLAKPPTGPPPDAPQPKRKPGGKKRAK